MLYILSHIVICVWKALKVNISCFNIFSTCTVKLLSVLSYRTVAVLYHKDLFRLVSFPPPFSLCIQMYQDCVYCRSSCDRLLFTHQNPSQMDELTTHDMIPLPNSYLIISLGETASTKQRKTLWIGVCDSVFQFLPKSSNFAYLLKGVGQHPAGHNQLYAKEMCRIALG